VKGIVDYGEEWAYAVPLLQPNPAFIVVCAYHSPLVLVIRLQVTMFHCNHRPGTVGHTNPVFLTIDVQFFRPSNLLLYLLVLRNLTNSLRLSVSWCGSKFLQHEDPCPKL
jgi:hypothetical protein